jgi:hypothetical protein
MSVSVSAITAHDERERKALAHAHMSAHERELYTPNTNKKSILDFAQT